MTRSAQLPPPAGTPNHSDPLNISRLTDQLWTGGDLPDPPERAADHIRRWHDLGIRTILDNREEWDDSELVGAVAPDITYHWTGVDDAGQRMPDWWFDEVTDLAFEGLRRGDGVLVHCHMGINRGPSAVYAVMLATGWDPIDAIDHIRTVRPIAAVGYAEDALDWWLRLGACTQAQRRAERRRLAQWRREHPHDTVRIIRQIRATGRA